jgi:hypothetical protein
MRYQITIFLVAFFFSLGQVHAQLEEDSNLVQFSGVVVTGDSLKSIPFATILVINRNRGTITDFQGAFSFVAQKGDSIRFSCIGFEPATISIPDTLSENRYSLIQMLTNDTVNLPEAVIYPWPSKEEFREAFLYMYIPPDDLARAEHNMRQERLYELATHMPNSGAANFMVGNRIYANQLYYAGQTVPISLLNPFAWAQFFNAWKNGDFKRKEKKKDYKDY